MFQRDYTASPLNFKDHEDRCQCCYFLRRKRLIHKISQVKYLRRKNPSGRYTLPPDPGPVPPEYAVRLHLDHPDQCDCCVLWKKQQKRTSNFK